MSTFNSQMKKNPNELKRHRHDLILSQFQDFIMFSILNREAV